MTTDTVISPDELTPARIAELSTMVEFDPDTEEGGSWRYTGPLAEGIALAHRDRFVAETKTLGTHTEHKVLLSDEAEPTDRNACEFGYGGSPEEAWRYAIGGLINPTS